MTDSVARLVPEKNEPYLNDKQYFDYGTHRRNFLEWLLIFGKDPDSVEGYAQVTVNRTARRCGKFDRFVWDHEGGYAIPTHDHADAYLRKVALEDFSGSHKSNTRDAILRYFKWRRYEYDEEKYEPDIALSKQNSIQPRDFLTLEERKKIRRAALEYDSIPNYDGLSPEDRTRWKKYVSQVLRKPLNEVVPADWEQVSGSTSRTTPTTTEEANSRVLVNAIRRSRCRKCLLSLKRPTVLSITNPLARPSMGATHMDVDPTASTVLERNYDYAQCKINTLAEWYGMTPMEMVKLLAEGNVELSLHDSKKYGTYYDYYNTNGVTC